MFIGNEIVFVGHRGTRALLENFGANVGARGAVVAVYAPVYLYNINTPYYVKWANGIGQCAGTSVKRRGKNIENSIITVMKYGHTTIRIIRCIMYMRIGTSSGFCFGESIFWKLLYLWIDDPFLIFTYFVNVQRYLVNVRRNNISEG